MKKQIFKILIFSLILLIGIGAVNALDFNSTDIYRSSEQNNPISTYNESIEVLTVENENNNTLSANDNTTEVLSLENTKNNVISVNSENNVISLSNETNNVLTQTKEKSILSLHWSYYTKSKTQYKIFTLAKARMSTKLLKYSDYIPTTKNKIEWNQYKLYKKQNKNVKIQIRKSTLKVLKRAVKQHWHPYTEVWYRYKLSSKYCTCTYYQKYYRTYNYNPVLDKGWWD